MLTIYRNKKWDSLVVKSLWIAIAWSLMALGACDDIIVENIENNEVLLLAPSNGARLDSANVAFWWDFVDGATDYQFQLVSPTFDSAVYFIMDSITTDNRISVSLNPGNYEWAVRALNNGYATTFYQNRFTVDTTGVGSVDISNETITLNTPANNASIASGDINFWWEEINEADSYRLQVVTPDFVSPQVLLLDTVTANTTVAFTITEAGTYQWRVKGINPISETGYTASSFMTTGSVSADDITLIAPTNNFRTNEQNLQFTWSFDGAVDFYVLRIDGPTTQDIVTTSTSTSVAIGDQSGEYNWWVTAVDNQNGSSVISDSLVIDYQSGLPAAPTLSTPTDGLALSLPFTFEWERQLDNIVRDSLFILNTDDSLVGGYPVAVSNESFALDGLAAGDYKWTVRSVDNQGQAGEMADSLTFTVQ